MISGISWMVRVLFFALAAHAALAAEPTLRMESRAALTEAEHPRLHSPDAAWLAQLPLAQTIRLAAPSEIELREQQVSRFEPRRRVGFGRTTDRTASTVIAAGSESALRFAVTSPGAIHLRVALKFSDSAQYRITSYRPGEEAYAVSLTRKPSDSSDQMQTVWTPLTDGDVQTVVVERVSALAGPWSVRIRLFLTSTGPCIQQRPVRNFLEMRHRARWTLPAYIRSPHWRCSQAWWMPTLELRWRRLFTGT